MFLFTRLPSTPTSSIPFRMRSRRKHRFFHVVVGVVIFALTSSVVLTFMLAPISTPLSPQSGAIVGSAAFLSSGQINPEMTEGYNDIVTITLQHLPSPAAGSAYDAWLLPDQPETMAMPTKTALPLFLGHLSAMGMLTYTSPTHANLLLSYSKLRITEQRSQTLPSAPNPDPATWRWEGWVPNTPNPADEMHYSLLAHLRHLLSSDPTLQANNLPGGLVLWLTRNVAKIEEWASAAQGQWHGSQTSDADADLIHRLMLRILAYLDGQIFYWRDVPANSPWLVDPLAGKIGLLTSVPNQAPPGYLEHVGIHLIGLANAPGHTKTQQQLATLIDHVIDRMILDLQQARKDAMALVQMNADQLRQSAMLQTLDEMANLTTEVKSGWFDTQTGENIGGVVWMTNRLQQLASFPVITSSQHLA